MLLYLSPIHGWVVAGVHPFPAFRSTVEGMNAYLRGSGGVGDMVPVAEAPTPLGSDYRTPLPTAPPMPILGEHDGHAVRGTHVIPTFGHWFTLVAPD